MRRVAAFSPTPPPHSIAPFNRPLNRRPPFVPFGGGPHLPPRSAPFRPGKRGPAPPKPPKTTTKDAILRRKGPVRGLSLVLRKENWHNGDIATCDPVDNGADTQV